MKLTNASDAVARSRSRSFALRVLHAPLVTGGHPAGLVRAERALGLKSWCFAAERDVYGFRADETVLGPRQSRLGRQWARVRMFWRALREFDVVHFNFGNTFFPKPLHFDLPVLKAAGKAIFVTYQGDDARQGDYCRANFDITFATRVSKGYYTPFSDALKRRSIAWIDLFADGIFALNPDLLRVLPARARFMPYASVDLEEWRPARADNEIPVLVHAPSHRLVKGTDLILAAAERLRTQGERFELVLVEGMPRTEARRIYERADIAVDQLFAGWYGGFAVEMMALAKPVLSYIRESDLRFVPKEMVAELPVIRVRPDNLVETLRAWIRAPRDRLHAIGAAGRAYVEKWHDPLKIAATLKRHYESALQCAESAR